jgi:hypothetical protein
MNRSTWVPFALLSVVLFGCGHAHSLEEDDGGGDLSADDGGGDLDAADGGEAGPASMCPSAPGCGGNLVGIWKVTSTCVDVDLSSYTQDCDSSTAHAMDYKITGTVTYYVDQTYSIVGALTGSVVLDLPTKCLTTDAGAQVSCARLEPALLASGKYQSVSCLIRNGGGCVCTFDINPQPVSGNGNFTATPAGVITDTDSSGMLDADYCIANDGTMTLSPPPGGAVLTQQGITSGSITLTKQ